jgi:IclR family acetate operon transcriptional repressor
MPLLDRAFGILRAVAASEGGATVSDVTRQTGLPKSTVSRLLATLEQLEAVERDAANAFTIGRGIVALAARVPHADTLAAIARPYLQELNERIGETVALALPEGDYAVVVDQISSRHAIQVRDWTGQRIEMYVLSTGRVFLAERSREALDRYLAAPLARYTSQTIVDPDELRAALDQVRTHGYAWIFEEYEVGLNAMAAPIRDRSSRAVAAVNVFGPAFRFPAEGQYEQITRLVVATAKTITGRLQQIGAPNS